MNGELVVFRVDASQNMGTGHVMRCLTIAQYLKKNDIDSVFICRRFTGNLIHFIEEKNFTVYALDDNTKNIPVITSIYDEWLGDSWQNDAKETLEIIGKLPVSLLIVDHYAISADWESYVNSHQLFKLYVIDDLADRTHICDLILDQTYLRHESSYHQLVPEYCQILTGSTYALLRDEFAMAHEQALAHKLQRFRSKDKLHILINMGGVDQNDTVGDVVEVLAKSKVSEMFDYTIVVGKNYPQYKELKNKVSETNLNFDLVVNATNMSELMYECDFAIGAAGSTTWERCCLGMPSILLCIADNQKDIMNTLMENKIALVIESPDQIENKLEYYLNLLICNNNALLKEMSAKASAIVDGKGVERLAQKIFDLMDAQLA